MRYATGSVNTKNTVSLPCTTPYVTGELEQAIQVYELWAKSYPQDEVPPGNLGAIYAELGQYEKALAETQEALRLEPNDVVGYGNLAQDYLALNRPDDATKAIEQAQERKLDGDTLHWKSINWPFSKATQQRWSGRWLGPQGNPGVKTSCSRSNPIRRRTTDGS